MASVNGWKEFSLGTAGGIDTLGLGSEGEELEEEKVYVPGTALPALVELLLSLCRLIDMTTALTPDVGRCAWFLALDDIYLPNQECCCEINLLCNRSVLSEDG